MQAPEGNYQLNIYGESEEAETTGMGRRLGWPR